MSLLIGEHVYSVLSTSQEVINAVGDRIYPISTVKETSFPFILYKRVNVTPRSTKDRYNTGDEVSVEVIIADNEYLRSIKIAEAVRNELEKRDGMHSSFSVTESRLSSASEYFVEETFIQELVFLFNTESNI